MTVIRQEDFISSVAGALQYISYYHPEDYIRALAQAYEREQSPAARDAMAQILINSRMCYEGHRPVCQDTGIVNAFVKLGMDVRFEAGPGEELLDLQQMIDAGVRRAYLDPDNKLRASLQSDPAGKRINTKDNTPAAVFVEVVRGATVEVTVAAKGGGSEAKSKFVMLNPNDSVVDWVLETVPTMGAGWCPPGILGIGIGGTAEKAMLLAKQSLMDPIDIQELIARGPKTTAEKLRVELYDKVNRLGIGAQGLGGLTTVLDVKVVDTPAHAANLPVAMIPNCAATRHAHIVLDGSGPVFLDPPSLSDWPKLTYDVSTATPVVWAISPSDSPPSANMMKAPRCSRGRASTAAISLCAASRDCTCSRGVGPGSATVIAASSRPDARTATFCRRKWSQTLWRAMVNSQAGKLAWPGSKVAALFETETQVS